MVERLGVDTEWAEKTKLSYNKLLKLLDPAERERFEKRGPAPASVAHPPAAPETPTAPARPTPSNPPAGSEVNRQIL
jgi:hypothetical protein